MARKVVLTEQQRRDIAHIRTFDKYETAETLGISEPLLRTYREKGLIRGIKMGGQYRYSQQAINRFLEDFEGMDLTGENLNEVAEEHAKKRALARA